jgi:hypothetical protein
MDKRAWVLIFLFGLGVAGFNAGLRLVAPAGWWSPPYLPLQSR